MSISRQKETSVVSLVILCTLNATSISMVFSLRVKTVLAQSPTPSFSLPTTVPSGTRVQIDGSTSMAAINQTLKESFEKKFSGTKVNLRYDGTQSALQSVQDGKIDLAAIGRRLTAEEKAKGLVEVLVTDRKIAIVVAPDNPFNTTLRSKQFAEILQGKIQNWSELGREAGVIRVVHQPKESDTRLAFRNYSYFQNVSSTNPNIVELSEDSTKTIIQNLEKNSISYAIIDQVVDRPGVRILEMYTITPADARYPFSQPMVYVYKGPNTIPAVQSFLGYATAPANKQLIENAKAAGAVATTPESQTSPNTNATTTSQVSLVQADSDSVVSQTSGTEVPWWLGLLSISLLGGLLWGLLKYRSRAAKVSRVVLAPVPAVESANSTSDSRIILVPRNSHNVYAYWEASKKKMEELKRLGGQKFMLRVYDVTNMNMDAVPAHTVQEFECHEWEQDRHVLIPLSDRDYVAEIGYTTIDGRWLSLVKSLHIRVRG